MPIRQFVSLSLVGSVLMFVVVEAHDVAYSNTSTVVQSLDIMPPILSIAQNALSVF
jgi:hypothetical protein